MKKFTKLMLLLCLCNGFGSAYSQVIPSCVLGYPDNSNLPRSQVVFNESEVLAATQLDTSAGANHAVIKLWYTDEHALLLGVRKVVIKSSTGITTTNYPITATPSAPTCVVSPLVGSRATSGDQVPNDVSAGGGRPLFPALFVTDLTVNGENSRVGDWQQGGIAIPPSRVCGTWKGATRTVDKTKSPALVTVTTDANPAKNNTDLGGGSLPSGGLRNEGFSAEVSWNISDLGLITGHRYRYQFMVHDGDQNKAGGDVGESVFCSLMPGTPARLTLGNLVWLDLNANNLKDAIEPAIPNATVKLYADANNDNIADGAALATTTTNASGNYIFTGLSAGNYIVGVIIPAGYTKGANTTTDPDNNLDNDNNGVNLIGANAGGGEVRSLAITLMQATEPTTDGDDNNGNLTLDIAFYPAPINLVLGNLVWLDTDGNGLKEATEVGLGGVTVKLYTDNNADSIPDGASIATTTTSSTGIYSFGNLAAGKYIVGVTIPNGYMAMPFADKSPDDNIDNDNNGFSEVNGEFFSNYITLSQGSEPTYDGDDANGNLTLDFALKLKIITPPGGCLNSLFGEGFETGTFSTGGSDLHHGLPRNGSYQIVNNVNQLGGGGYLNIQAHTGSYFLAAHTSNTVTDRVWYANIAVTPGKTYNFCTYVTLLKNLGDGANYILGLYANGQLLDTGRVTFSWTSICGNFTVPAGVTSIELSIRDPKKGLFFVAIDDICVTEVANLTLGNLVWLDLNANNIKDTFEPVIPNATVKLYVDANNDNVADGAAVATTTTNSNGLYSFTGLSAGNYIVGVTIPASYQARLNGTVDPDNNVDNDNNGVNLVGANVPGSEVRSNAITLLQGTEPTTDGDDSNGNLTLDFGLCPIPNKLTLGNLIWSDLNANNIKDATEPGIPNATVNLYLDANNDNIADGAAIATTTTNASGAYSFPNLADGNYIVGVIFPSGYSNGGASSTDPDNDVDNDNNGVNVIGNEVRSLSITLSGFTEPTTDGDDSNGNQTLDIALYPNILNVGNQIWNDLDLDGRRDSNEPGIPNVPVSIYFDANGDNIPDSNIPFATTNTNIQGIYSFTNLAPGRYIISIPELPGFMKSSNTGTQATSPFPDNDVDNDNNGVNLVNGIIYTNGFTLSFGGEPITDGDGSNGNLTIDIGMCGTSFIGDFVWNDLNGNGIQDVNEPGINNQTVTITYADGTVGTTTTLNFNGKDGYYDFKDLGPGTYVISFTTPTGLQPSPSNQGSNDALDSDPVNGSVTVSLAANVSDFTIDAGFYNPAFVNILKLGNFVWNDFDGDGRKDSNEPGIGNITVNIYRDADGDNINDTDFPFATTSSNTQGFYSFSNLAPGRYIISIPIIPGFTISPNSSTQATSPFPDNNVDNDNNGVKLMGGLVFSNAITLTIGGEPSDAGNTNNTLDMALCGIAFIGDFVWNDLNGNGIQDLNEPGINGATINLTFADGTIATTTTANFNGKDGYYDFKNLGPATYVVSFVTPTGLTPSPANQGSDDALDSDPVNGSVSVTLVASVSNFTIDAGFTTAGGICGLGNLVFIDLNYNGIRDLSEPGIPGATVNLYRDSNGDNVPDGPAIATTTTLTDGSYKFTKLTTDSYIVGVVIPSTSYAFNPTSNALPNNDVDNDNNGVRLVGSEVRTNFITLSPSTEPTYDGDDNNTNSTLDIAMKVNTVCRTPFNSYTNVSEEFSNSLSVYPNPAVRNFTLSIKAEKQGFGIIWIIDQNGRTVMSKTQMLNKGSNILSLNADNRMTSGVYTIQSVVDGKVMTSRLVIGK